MNIFLDDIPDLTSNEHPYFNNQLWRVIYVTMPAQKRAPVFSPPHFAETLEILLTQGIEGEITINGRTEAFAQQSAYIIPPKIIHSMKYLKGGDFIICLQINIDELMAYMNLDNILSKDSFSIHNCFSRCTNFETLHKQIISLSTNNSFTHNLSIILSLFSFFTLPSNQNEQSKTPNLTEIIKYIEKNYSKNLTLSNVATHFGYHKNYFCNYFKKNLGTPFIKYLNSVRIANACYFLASNYSINSVCRLCGFSNTNYFIKIFKQSIGLTPTQYIKSLKQKALEIPSTKQ